MAGEINTWFGKENNEENTFSPVKLSICAVKLWKPAEVHEIKIQT